MDRQAFKQRMKNLKSYRENNPGKGYWDWKVEAFQDGGVSDNLVGSYSNYTGTPTMYVPVTKEYEAVPEGFGEIANVHTPEVTITPQNNISLVEAVDKGRRNAFEYIKEAASYIPTVGDAMDIQDAVYQATQGNYGKAAFLGGLALLPNIIQKPLQKFKKLHISDSNIVQNSIDLANYLGFRFGHPIIKPERIDKVSKRFRNREWSNFLSTVNSDSYFRMARGTELSKRNPDERLFVSHTTPWEEFSGLGSSEPSGIKTLFEFPTNTFGVRTATDHKGVPGNIDVTEYGRSHLLYGNYSSGERSKMRMMSDSNAQLLDMDPYTIGVKDRPLNKHNFL